MARFGDLYANLDTNNGAHIFDLLLKLNQERKTTLVLVTHDHSLAGKAERKISLRGGEVVEDFLKST